ncbi:MAG: tetratricopeptide repeat protein, partial [Flammeovirgaceae bacterium]
TCHYGLAYFFWVKGNYATALEHGLLSLSASEKLTNNTKLLSDDYLLLGNIYVYMPDWTKAKRNYLLALKNGQQLQDQSFTTRCLNNLGYVHVQLKQYDSALQFLQRALVINQNIGNAVGEAYNLSNMGEVQALLGSFKNAKDLLHQSLKVNINDNRLKSRNYYELAKVLMSEDSVAQSRKAAEKALTFAREINSAYDTKQAAFVLYQLAEKKKDTPSAFKFYKIFIHIEDSLSQSSLKEKMEILQNKYELEKKVADMTIVERENKLPRLELQRQNTRIIVAIAMMALLIALVFALVQRNRRKNEFLEELTLKNEEIRAQAEELAALNNQLDEINRKLELKVEARTMELIEKNERIAGYAFHNSHRLRGPLATLLGLVHLINQGYIPAKELPSILEKIQDSAIKVDAVVREITDLLKPSADELTTNEEAVKEKKPE